jgi:hypothetical protein
MDSEPIVTEENDISHLNPKVRYTQGGLGGRHAMFHDSIIGEFSEHCELVVLCDLNEGRLKLLIDQVAEQTGLRDCNQPKQHARPIYLRGNGIRM